MKYLGHDFVEITGIKWATMNIGANSITDGGLYFQWGDTQGYTAAQAGTSSGQKAFKWDDYKYGDGTLSPGTSGMTKYNSTDGKTVLDISDDAAQANWGGSWRMPTTNEIQTLGAATTSAWTADYQGSGIAGLILTDKIDSSKVLFFPAAGQCSAGSSRYVNTMVYYWTSSLDTDSVNKAYELYSYNNTVNFNRKDVRSFGFPVRGVFTGTALTDEELNYSSNTATIYQENQYTLPVLINTHNLELTFNSSNTNVATINSSGIVSIVGNGTTTISAIFAGNEEYNTKTISYSLTVDIKKYLNYEGLSFYHSKIIAELNKKTTYVPTLNQAPTSSTLSYTKDGKSYNFAVGNFCRVEDSEDTYIFYQLYDLNNGVATWIKQCMNSSEVDTKINAAIADLLDGAPSTFDTLKELADWIADDQSGAAKLASDITKKADKLSMTGAGAATENNLMAIDANGNIKDSGKKPNDFQATLVVGTNLDSIPTANSNHPVTSGGVKTALDGMQVKINDRAIIGDGSAVCNTACDTPQKEITITDFLLIKNGVVSVRFANAITVASPTLKINDNAAKAIYLNGAAVPPGWILAGVTVNMRYNGAQFDIISMMGPEKTDDELLVNMGLPSGLLWATRNIDVTQANGFAKNIYQYECSFFSWGNTDGHNPTATNLFAPYSWGNVNTSEPYASSPGAALTASFGLSFDAAFANLGNQWRMPTTEEFAELFSNIDYLDADGAVIDAATADKRCNYNGVMGLRLRSKINSKEIFFPASGDGYGQSWSSRGSYGYYWSSSLYSAAYGRYLYFGSGGVNPQGNSLRFYGFAVRPVQNNPSNS